MDPLVEAYLEARRAGSLPHNAVTAVNTDRLPEFDRENWLRWRGNPYPWLIAVAQYLKAHGIQDLI